MNLQTKIKLPDIPNPNSYAGFLFWQKSNSWEKYINSILKQFKLNQAEYLHLVSLFWLQNNQPQVVQADLAQYTGVTSMGTSKILVKLEKLDFISRFTGDDSRSKAVTVTQNGLKVLMETANEIGKADKLFFSEQDKSTFINYLAKLK